jgi:multidrug resistance efflux pump
MPSLPWSATLRSLEADRRGGRMPALAAAVVLAAAWAAWGVGAEVEVTVESGAAALEPRSARCVLSAPVEGIVAARWLALGRHVEAGEVVARLDDGEPRVRLAAVAGRRAALLAAATAVAAERAAARRGAAEEGWAQVAAGGEREERAREAAAAAALATENGGREARLEAAGLLAHADAARGRAEAEQRRRAAAAAVQAAAAGAAAGRAALADRRAAAERLAGDAARLGGELAALAGEAAAIEQAMALRQVRAPVAGRLAEVTAARAGAFVARGTPLAVLVPDAPLRVVASFGWPAAGALRPGQRAKVLLAAGATSRAAALPATVAAVAPAGRSGGGWEVQLELAAPAGRAAAGLALPRAGQPCRVEVEVARRTPVALALEALGRAAGAAGRGREDGR